MSGTLSSRVNNIQTMIPEEKKKMLCIKDNSKVLLRGYINDSFNIALLKI